MKLNNLFYLIGYSSNWYYSDLDTPMTTLEITRAKWFKTREDAHTFLHLHNIVKPTRIEEWHMSDVSIRQYSKLREDDNVT